MNKKKDGKMKTIIQLFTILVIFISGCATYKVNTEPQGADIYRYYEKEPNKEKIDINTFNSKNLKYYGKSPINLGFNPKLYPFVIQAKMDGFNDSKLLTNTDFQNQNFLISLNKNIHISINSSPSTADIFFSTDNLSFQHIGKTPFIFYLDEESISSLYFKISKNAYFESKVFDYTDFHKSETYKYILDVNLINYPTLKISSNPTNCDIYKYISNIDNNNIIESEMTYVGKSPFDITIEPKLKHIYFQARTADYENSNIIHYETKDDSKILKIELGKKIIRYGNLKITGNIIKSYVYIDGKKIEKINRNEFNKKLETGQHTISIDKSGYRRETFTISIFKDKITTYDIVLSEIKFGWIKLTSNEGNVDIYLDNENIGALKSGLPFNKKVEIGEHQISAKKDFFMPNTIIQTMKENEVFEHYFELKKASGWIEQKPSSSNIVQATGKLTIATERSDIKVYIEGAEKTPTFTLDNVPAGIYNIKVVGNNLNENMQIIIENNEEKFIDLDVRFPE